MAKIDEYREMILEILTEYSSHKPAYGDVEVELILDPERDRYLLVHAGWSNRRRIYGCTIHIDLKGDKIWIQNDGTEVGIANVLVERGVSPQDIVIAYNAPYLRKFTDFAVG
ncbi:MAG: XisI protein [Hormoscilla sp. SP5CHS1]|nr:XisI protein [Hormoscilla sp. SP12CHS1]MBC6455037.1 XisI protein [Hormoscilla sp. SP5CHS1]